MTIYLDHNATTPTLRAVVDGMLPYLREHFGNPSSSHEYGRRARDAVDLARSQVADLLGCAPEEVLFTSGGTEANNIAIRGVAEASARRHLITSSIEHPATTAPCRYLSEHGWRVDFLAVDRAGQVDAAELRRRLGDDTALVTVMHANNETGSLQPIAELAEAAHVRGALIHTDAAQSVGKVPVRVGPLGVDLLTLAGHKLNAPLNVRFPRAAGSAVLAATPEVAASTGSACHEGGEVASSVLLAMGIDPVEALGAVRLSVGVTTTPDQVDTAADALARGWRQACEGR